MDHVNRLAANDLAARNDFGLSEAKLSIQRMNGMNCPHTSGYDFAQTQLAESQIKGQNRTGDRRRHLGPDQITS